MGLKFGAEIRTVAAHCALFAALAMPMLAQDPTPLPPHAPPKPLAAGPVPLWSRPNTTPKFPATFGTIPGSDRASGIAVWDANHLLTYSLRATGQLALHKGRDTSEGAWTFLVEVRNLNTGAIEQTAEIPAGSKRSELALVSGGLVESDPNRIRFYSRSFQKIEHEFHYTSLIPDPLISRRVPGRIDVANDLKHFMVVDQGGARSRIYLFDGDTLQQLFTGVIYDMDPTSITIGEAGYFYSGFGLPGEIYFGTFGSAPRPWRTNASAAQGCRVPVYLTPDSFLDVCGAVILLTRRGFRTLHHAEKNEGASAPAVLSPDKQRIAAHGYQWSSGSMFDWSAHLNGLSVWIIALDGSRSCQVPIATLPHYQFSFTFIDPAHLIILSDSTVSAYAIPCTD